MWARAIQISQQRFDVQRRTLTTVDAVLQFSKAERLSASQMISRLSEIVAQGDPKESARWPSVIKRVVKRLPGFSATEAYQLRILRADKRFAKHIMEQLAEEAADLSDIQLVHLMNVARPGLLFPELLDELPRRMLDAKEITLAAQALSKHDVKDHPAVKHVVELFRKKLDEFSPTQLCSCALAIARLGADADLLQEWQVRYAQLGDWAIPRHWAAAYQILFLLRFHGVKPDMTIVANVRAQAIERYKRFTVTDSIEMLWASCLWQHYDPKLFHALLPRVLETPRSNLDPDVDNRLQQVWLSLKLDPAAKNLLQGLEQYDLVALFGDGAVGESVRDLPEELCEVPGEKGKIIEDFYVIDLAAGSTAVLLPWLPACPWNYLKRRHLAALGWTVCDTNSWQQTITSEQI